MMSVKNMDAVSVFAEDRELLLVDGLYTPLFEILKACMDPEVKAVIIQKIRNNRKEKVVN